MSEEAAEALAEAVDPLVRPLRKLTESYGIRSAALHADLGPELRRLFYVPDWDTDALRTLARVTWHLDRLISTQLVGDDMEQVARVSYNLGEPEIRKLKLGQRRASVHKTQGRPSPSESQRDLRQVIVPAFAASLRRDPPPRPADRDVAALMAAETGRPLDDHLPFPTEQPPAPPPPPERPAGGIHVTIGRLIVIVLSLVVAIAAAVVMSSMRGSNSADSSATSTAAATRPLAVPTVAAVGGNRHGSPTFKDPFHPAETGPKVAFRQTVLVSCKLQAFSLDSIGRDGYWYRIASPPWSDRYYSPAITFLNGDPVDGPYDHSYDPAVPNC